MSKPNLETLSAALEHLAEALVPLDEKAKPGRAVRPKNFGKSNKGPSAAKSAKAPKLRRKPNTNGFANDNARKKYFVQLVGRGPDKNMDDPRTGNDDTPPPDSPAWSRRRRAYAVKKNFNLRKIDEPRRWDKSTKPQRTKH